MTTPTWRQFELLVAEIQSQLAPGLQVQHDAHLRGRTSNVDRQVDVLLSGSVGQFPIQIAIDCKDYAIPIDVTHVDAFVGLIQDTGVHKGVMVAAKGFTRAAKSKAAAAQVDLYTVVDTNDHQWRAKNLGLPVLCDFREANMQIGYRHSAPAPLAMPSDFLFEAFVFDESGAKIGRVVETATQRWLRGDYSIEPGRHSERVFSQSKTLLDNGSGQMVQFELSVNLDVR